MDSRELAAARRTTRELVGAWAREGRFSPSCDAWLRGYDLDFTRAMAARGLIGISWPAEYGGGGGSALTRLVVTEELLRAGAPVAAHWIADRQIGPSIVRHGSDAAKARFLPAIASGEVTFCLGMSEPDAGSDLASVRTAATRAEGGWLVTGRKIWTSQAHRSTHAYVLARTGKGDKKHEGLTEFIVDMAAPGVDVRPIHDLAGEHHFNEVTFDAVFVPDEHVLGTVGNGWKQVTEQLALERGGIERVLSTYPLLTAAIEAVSGIGRADDGAGDRADEGAGDGAAPRTGEGAGDGTAERTGEVLARLATLRAMAFDVAGAMDEGRAPVHEAAMLKDLGTTLERDVVELARALLDTEVDPGAAGAEGLLAQGILAAPGFTIRGGTTEVLRTVISRGAVAGGRRRDTSDLGAVVDQVLAGHGGEPGDDLPGIWDTVRELGWTAVGVDEAHGGEGGDLGDVVTIVEGLGRHHVSVPLAETVLARRALAAAGHSAGDDAGHDAKQDAGREAGHDAGGAGSRVGSGVATVALPRRGEGVRFSAGGRLYGTVTKVPWGRHAGRVVVPATLDSGAQQLAEVRAGAAGLSWVEGANLAGEPRDTLRLDGTPAASLGGPGDLLAEASLLRAAALTGALLTALDRTVAHVTVREQFGRPLIAFQAVASLVAALASEAESARVAVRRATAALAEGHADAWARVAAARVVTARAATEGARVAHQAHAAMGITREHPLHLATRRLWAWRDEFGTARWWAGRLGRVFIERGPDDLWRWITEDAGERWSRG
ncbi:acyl-CoA dehydrogenase family protein [Nonomuraea sp. MCN248]|uniref:Acyl-CoA dehydrogenase family protein n=1 Tax=Nonomuraea corallina TaxID=2989783 RepID=A0ABT4SEG4_9ACTN|nr:acyl-CoA dehydrogenase family protein [Nonomuraea corallina]MDA0635594.1 acyl-CoA dehydrogenase family protein [Nonomuraea corallina]